jgi:hypothetical protein
LALTLLDYYRALVRRRADLRETKKRSKEERKMLASIAEILDQEQKAPTILDQLEEGMRPESSGDTILDEWYAALDRGDVPKDLVVPPKKKQGEQWRRKSPRSA